MELKVKIVNRSTHKNPEYATPGAAGMDLRAFLDEPVTLQSLERRMIPTGIYLEIPQGFEAQVRPRSGLAAKNGLTCLNSPGTVDSDYRGELKVILVNLGRDEQIIQNGDRIAQMVFCKVENAILEDAAELNDTKRGSGGFGHTGVN